MHALLRPFVLAAACIAVSPADRADVIMDWNEVANQAIAAARQAGGRACAA